MSTNVIKHLKTSEDVIYFVREIYNIQAEMLEYFSDLDEKDRTNVVSELTELEDNIQKVSKELERNGKSNSTTNKELITPKNSEPLLGYSINFNKLLYIEDFSEIDKFKEEFYSERDKIIEEFEKKKIDEKKINNEIKEYILNKRKHIDLWQKKLKTTDSLVRILLSNKYHLNSDEKIFIIFDTLRLLKTISFISINYIVEKWSSLQRTYYIFKKIHDYFIKQELSEKDLKVLSDFSPLVEEISTDNISKKYKKERPLMLPSNNITKDQIILSLEFNFWEYFNILSKLFKYKYEIIFKNIAIYEKIKEKFKPEIESLFMERVAKALNNTYIPEYEEINEWKFNFIKNKNFKNIIERDFEELRINLREGCLKSSLMLLGSILEAILFDLFYENDDLIKKKYEEKYPKRKYEYSYVRVYILSEVANEIGIITKDLKVFCDTIWRLRNNIHTMKEINEIDISIEYIKAGISLLSILIKNLINKKEYIDNKIQTKIPELELKLIGNY